MFSVGGGLVKLLAVATAFLTVATGVPRVQCVCPDGRVKFHCPGAATSVCCCEGSSFAREAKSWQSYCRTEGTTPTCCRRAKAKPSIPSGDGEAWAASPRRGQRALVINVLVATAEDAGDGDGSDADAVTWVGHSAAPKQTTHAARRERSLLPPHDRVVLFCHFTC